MHELYVMQNRHRQNWEVGTETRMVLYVHMVEGLDPERIEITERGKQIVQL